MKNIDYLSELAGSLGSEGEMYPALMDRGMTMLEGAWSPELLSLDNLFGTEDMIGIFATRLKEHFNEKN